MQTLQISEQKAFELYPTASTEFKTMLDETFGKDFFKRKIADRVKTFEDACNILGETSENINILLSYNGINADLKAAQAFVKLTIIARALNEGWKPDWNNGSQYKYVPWFKANKSGSGLSFGGCVYWSSLTFVGSRLCFKNSELAEYAGTQFIDLYNEFLTIQ